MARAAAGGAGRSTVGGPMLRCLFAAALLAPPLAAERRDLPPERRARLEALIADVERLRGLAAPPDLEVRAVDAAGLVEELDALMAQQLPEAVLRPAERALKLFGLLPPQIDLAVALRDILAAQVVGFFDPQREVLVLVDGDHAAQGIAEETVMVHELGHLVQHAHFDLARLVPDDPLSDRAAAVQALVEGDATLVMLRHLLGDGEEQEAVLRSLLTTPERLGRLLAGDLGPGLEDAPTYLREGLVFPYLQGLVFCAALRAAGGQELLDSAFRERPPQSSEQILHPEKWLGQSDPPVEIDLPDLAGLLGRPRRAAGSLGERDLRILLEERLPGLDPAVPRGAAEGWGGDAFALYGDAPDDLLVWVTEWDTSEDAAEFRTLAADAFPASPPSVEGGTRVVVLLGNQPDRPAPLLTLLRDAPARPARAVR